jgi:hypothetical protein
LALSGLMTSSFSFYQQPFECRQPPPRSFRTDTFLEMQQKVFALAETAVDFPPMQAPASFNLESTKHQIDEVMRESEG